MLVADIDEPVVAAATRTPFEARRRVFVIESADTMHDATANRLLKTLEEPADVRPPDPAHARARARCCRRSRRAASTSASRRRAPRASRAARGRGGVDPATAEACGRLALGDGERALGARARRRARRCATRPRPTRSRRCEGERRVAAVDGAARDRPAAGEAAGEELAERHGEDLELAARSERARIEREHAERVKRAVRRRSRAHARPRPRRSSSCGTATPR